MKKKLLILATALILTGSAFAFGACAGGGNDDTADTPAPTAPATPTTPSTTDTPATPSTPTTPTTPSTPTTPTTPTTPVNPDLKQFTGLALADGNAVYDGAAHPLTVSGELPEGASVSYSANNNSVNAGTYAVTATVTASGYQDKQLTATLTISKGTITGLKFENAAYSYDGTAHSVELVGTVPEGSSVSYKCKENSMSTNSATETGEYTITVTVTNANYNTFTAEAKLKITAEDKNRFITAHDGTLYFANALDGDKLYKYDSTDGIKKVSPDVPYNFAEAGGNLYFRSYSPYASSVKTVETNGVKTVISVKGEYLCSDGDCLYYAVNSLTQSKSGIYKLDISDSEPAAQLISEGKAKYLTCADNHIYFADGANGDRLTKISISGGTRTLVTDEKITCLTHSDGALYYTVNNLTGDYIERYTIADGTRRKLTSDAGANLTVIGNKLYYINVDLLNSAVFGKGIYSVNANPAINNQLPGTKIIEGDDLSYSSLTEADGKLAYYRVSDQMLCISDTDGSNTLELLEGFIAPETVPLSTGSKTAAYGKALYFLDLYNDKALYSYNTVSKALSRVTSDKVSDFAILGDYLYFNSVSYGVNNDLYKVNLKLGGEPELISGNDCNDIVTDGNNIYYIKENAGGAATAITEIAADGTETDIFDKGVSNLVYYEGYIYFEYNNKVHRMPVNGYTVNQTENVTHADVSHVGTFAIENGVIYFRELYGLAWGLKRLSKMNIDGTGYEVMMTEKTDPLEISIADGKVYYYNDVTTGAGLYSLSADAAENEEPQLILACQSKYYARNLTIIDGKIYFINYRLNLGGDSHLYCVNISGGNAEKIA